MDYNQTKEGVENADKLFWKISKINRTKGARRRRRLLLLQLSDDLARTNMETWAQYKKHKAYLKSALRDYGIAVYSATKAADESAN